MSSEQPEAKMEEVAAPAAEEQPNNKRKAEDAAGNGGDEQPAAKAQKTEEGAAEEAGAGEADADAEAPAEAAAQEEPAAASEPVQIGYKTFASGKEAKNYYHGLIGKLRKYQNLNDVSRAVGQGASGAAAVGGSCRSTARPLLGIAQHWFLWCPMSPVA